MEFIPFHRLRQGVALGLSLALVWTAENSAAAAGIAMDLFTPSSNLSQFQLQPPARLGRLTDYFNAAGSRLQASGKTPSASSLEPTAPLVILIQDLHAHYGVQKNIAGLLEFLNQKLSPSAVNPSLHRSLASSLPFALAVEGAAGPVDNSVLALYPDKKIRAAATDYLLREAEITGADAFAVAQDMPGAIMGVENPRFYQANRDLFRQSLRGRRALVRALDKIAADLATLPRALFSQDLKTFEMAARAYQGGPLGADQWIAQLLNYPTREPRDLQTKFPALARYIAGSRALSQAALQAKTAQFLMQIAPQLSAQEKKNLKILAKSQSAAAYYHYLRELIDQKNLLTAMPTDLAAYLDYLHTLQTSDMDRVLFELQGLAYQTELAMAQGQARDFIRVRHDVDLLKRIADLQATEIEVQEFAPRLPEFLALARTLLVKGEGLSVKGNRRSISAAIDYYVMAMTRNQPMVANTLALLAPRVSDEASRRGSNSGGTPSPTRSLAHSPTVAVLIAGGFHTASLTQILRAKNISYVVLTPTVDYLAPADHLLYLRRLSGTYLSEGDILAAAQNHSANFRLALGLPERSAERLARWFGAPSAETLAVARDPLFDKRSAIALVTLGAVSLGAFVHGSVAPHYLDDIAKLPWAATAIAAAAMLWLKDQAAHSWASPISAMSSIRGPTGPTPLGSSGAVPNVDPSGLVTDRKNDNAAKEIQNTNGPTLDAQEPPAGPTPKTSVSDEGYLARELQNASQRARVLLEGPVPIGEAMHAEDSMNPSDLVSDLTEFVDGGRVLVERIPNFAALKMGDSVWHAGLGFGDVSPGSTRDSVHVSFFDQDEEATFTDLSQLRRVVPLFDLETESVNVQYLDVLVQRVALKLRTPERGLALTIRVVGSARYMRFNKGSKINLAFVNLKELNDDQLLALSKEFDAWLNSELKELNAKVISTTGLRVKDVAYLPITIIAFYSPDHTVAFNVGMDFMLRENWDSLANQTRKLFESLILEDSPDGRPKDFVQAWYLFGDTGSPTYLLLRNLALTCIDETRWADFWRHEEVQKAKAQLKKTLNALSREERNRTIAKGYRAAALSNLDKGDESLPGKDIASNQPSGGSWFRNKLYAKYGAGFLESFLRLSVLNDFNQHIFHAEPLLFAGISAALFLGLHFLFQAWTPKGRAFLKANKWQILLVAVADAIIAFFLPGATAAQAFTLLSTLTVIHYLVNFWDDHYSGPTRGKQALRLAIQANVTAQDRELPLQSLLPTYGPTIDSAVLPQRRKLGLREIIAAA